MAGVRTDIGGGVNMAGEPTERTETVVAPGVGLQERKRRKRKPKGVSKEIPRFNVVLWNDDDHTYAYVIRMLKELFGHPVELGYTMARTVDTRGRVIVLTTTFEHAELKRDQIHAYGADPDLRASKGSMTASIEKVET